MSNTTTSIRAILHICHSPLTWKDNLTWDIMPEATFTSWASFQEWVKGLLNGPTLEGGSYIEYWVTQDDGTEKWFSTKYAYWTRLLPDEEN